MADERIDKATEQLLGVLWDGLGVLEHEGALHFPHQIRRRKKDGSIEAVDVALKVIDNPRRFRARVDSREWAGNLNLDLDRDKDLVAELEKFEMLAHIIRDPKPPFIQHMQHGKDLFERYLLAELSETWNRHELLIDVVDGRFGSLNADEAWETILEVARRGEPSPLAGMPGFGQASCIALSARAACASPLAPSWVQQRWISNSASSPESS